MFNLKSIINSSWNWKKLSTRRSRGCVFNVLQASASAGTMTQISCIFEETQITLLSNILSWRVFMRYYNTVLDRINYSQRCLVVGNLRLDEKL